MSSTLCKCGCGRFLPLQRGRGRPREFATDECRIRFNNALREPTGFAPGRRRSGPDVVGGPHCMDCDLPTAGFCGVSFLGWPLDGYFERVCPDCAEIRRKAARLHHEGL